MNASPSKGEDTGYQASDQDRAKADSLSNQVTANNSQFNGPVQSSPFYKSMLQQGTSSTNAAYDNAQRSLKTQMEGAGIGGSSGAAQGNNAAVGAQRASALGKVGTDATLSATQLQQQANAQQLQQAGMYSGAGLGYYSGANQDEQQRLAGQGSLFNGLLQAGTTLGSAAILA